jgi:hypothetical protein
MNRKLVVFLLPAAKRRLSEENTLEERCPTYTKKFVSRKKNIEVVIQRGCSPETNYDTILFMRITKLDSLKKPQNYCWQNAKSTNTKKLCFIKNILAHFSMFLKFS